MAELGHEQDDDRGERRSRELAGVAEPGHDERADDARQARDDEGADVQRRPRRRRVLSFVLGHDRGRFRVVRTAATSPAGGPWVQEGEVRGGW